MMHGQIGGWVMDEWMMHGWMDGWMMRDHHGGIN